MKENTDIKYRIYHKGYKLEEFTRTMSCPLMFYKGEILERFGLRFEIISSKKIPRLRVVNIYVRLENAGHSKA